MGISSGPTPRRPRRRLGAAETDDELDPRLVTACRVVLLVLLVVLVAELVI